MGNEGVSIIIPAKNEENYLPKLLEAISFQRGISNIEKIVSVAPTTIDKTVLIAEDHGCKVVEGGMPATSRNNGAKAASYDTLFFLDADTYPDEKYFLLNATEEFRLRELDVAGTLLKPDYVGNKLKEFAYRGFYGIEMYLFLKKENSLRPVMQSGMFFDKNSFFELGGFREGIFREDAEIAERAVRSESDFKFGILTNCEPLRTSVRRYEERNFLKILTKILYLNAKIELFGYRSSEGTIDFYFNE